MDKLLLCDLDGTLREPFNGGKFGRHPRDQKIVEGTDKVLKTYDKSGWLIVGITNQGGVKAGYKTIDDCIAEQKYTLTLFPELKYIYFCPDEGKECWLVMRKVRPHAIHQKPKWGYCWSGIYRKPDPGMIIAAIFGAQNNWRKEMLESIEAVVELSQYKQHLMVGDGSEDKLAAQNAGIDFVWAHDWKVETLSMLGQK